MRWNVESNRWGKKVGEPRLWDRGSEYGVIESAQGGGLWVREESKECWDDRVWIHKKSSRILRRLCPSRPLSLDLGVNTELSLKAYLYTALIYSVPSNQSAKEAGEKRKSLKKKERGEQEKDRERLWDLALLLPQANPILSCLFYYPTTEQDRLVQYRACTDPFSFFGSMAWKRKERERNRGGINK